MNFYVIHRSNGDFDVVARTNEPLKLGKGMVRIDIGMEEEGRERVLPMFTAIRPGK